MKQRIVSIMLALALTLALALPALAADLYTPGTTELYDANGVLVGTYSLDTSLRDFQDGYTIRLLTDFDGIRAGQALDFSKSVTLDFNGYTVHSAAEITGSCSVTLKGGTLRGTDKDRLPVIDIYSTADVTLEDMTVIGDGNTPVAVGVKGRLTVLSGTYTALDDAVLCYPGGNVTLVSGTFEATGGTDGCIVKNARTASIRLAEGSRAFPADNWLGVSILGATTPGASRVIVEHPDTSGQSGTGTITVWKNPGFIKPVVEPIYTGGESVMESGCRAGVEQAAPWLLLEVRASGAALLEELVLTVGEDYHLYVSDTGGTVFALTAAGRARLQEAGAKTLTLEFANCIAECKL